MKRVLVFGTFDPLHPGHINFFEQAGSLGDHLIVSVAHDTNVLKIKGKKPIQNQDERIDAVEKEELVDMVVPAREDRNYILQLREEKPDIIALGYDQEPSDEKLRAELNKAGLQNIKVVRLKAFKPHLYKSSLLKK